MPIDEVNISRRCSNCGTELEVLAVKKDNMMMFSKEKVWCPECQSDQPELRDVSGRHGSINEEVKSYPKAVPANKIIPS